MNNPDYLSSMQSTLEEIVRSFKADSGTIHLLQSDVLVLQAHVGLPPAVLEKVRHVPIGKGMAGLAVQRNEPVCTCNIPMDTTGDIQPGAKASGVGGAIVVPIRDAEGNAQGALGIGVRREYEYTEKETGQLLIEAARVLEPP